MAGGAQPSVADLLMACEIEMLCLLDAADEVMTSSTRVQGVPRAGGCSALCAECWAGDKQVCQYAGSD